MPVVPRVESSGFENSASRRRGPRKPFLRVNGDMWRPNTAGEIGTPFIYPRHHLCLWGVSEKGQRDAHDKSKPTFGREHCLA